jgi:hypothetical protein
VGHLFDHVDRRDHHRDGTYPLAHHPVPSFSVRGPVRFPLGLRLYRRDEDLTPWEAAVTTHVPDLTIPRDTKGRKRLPQQVDPVVLQEPDVRARHEPFRTTMALAVARIEAAIRHQVPFGVGVFDAWSLAEDVVQVLTRRRKDGISLLNKHRRLETASVHRRDAHGWALKRPVPYIAVEARVPLIPAKASRPVNIRAHTYGCVTLAVRLPGLGKVRIVVRLAHESLTGRSVVLVTHRVDGSAATRIDLYSHRWPTEIVSTHMTKRGGVPRGVCGDDVPPRHLVVGDEDAIDPPFHPWSAVGSRAWVQGRRHRPANLGESLGPGRARHRWRRLSRQRAPRLRHAWGGLGHLRSCARARVALEALGPLDLPHAGGRPFERRAGSVRLRQRSCQTTSSRARAGATRAGQRSERGRDT